ncbi:MAG: efflux RND transporter periplasmic adaptor subunit, partial [Armatimonadota bacterium]
GGTVEVRIDALPGKTSIGRIGRIHPVGSVNSRNFTVRVDLDGESGAERPGMFARGVVSVDLHTAVLVSKDAIVKTETDQDCVFEIRDQRAYRKLVKMGIVGDRDVEVLEGVGDGADVVVAGQSGLKEGALVSVRGDEAKGR